MRLPRPDPYLSVALAVALVIALARALREFTPPEYLAASLRP